CRTIGCGRSCASTTDSSLEMPRLKSAKATSRPFPKLAAADLRVRPLARAETIPSAWYTDPGFHELDRHAVFAATWQHVADLRQLARPAAPLLADVPGEPTTGCGGGDAERARFS